MVQQIRLLFSELDRHGGAERLVASASRGAGSADNGESDDFPVSVETLCETSLREMSLDEVCEALAAKGLDMYVGLFQRESLDGARLCEMDPTSLLAMGLDGFVRPDLEMLRVVLCMHCVIHGRAEWSLPSAGVDIRITRACVVMCSLDSSLGMWWGHVI
jgi:hypothetical protein